MIWYLGRRNDVTAKSSSAPKNSDDPKSKHLNPEHLKTQTDTTIDFDLVEMMDQQIEKIQTDHEWTEKWMVDYEGYQPIGEPSLPLPQPTRLKTHKCNFCPELFSTPHHRKLHEIVHSNKRPFGKYSTKHSVFAN